MLPKMSERTKKLRREIKSSAASSKLSKATTGNIKNRDNANHFESNGYGHPQVILLAFDVVYINKLQKGLSKTNLNSKYRDC